MKVIKIDPYRPDPAAINEAVQMLAAGGMIIYPTDTSYGVGVDPTNPVALDRLHRFKQREPAKGVSLLISSLEMAKRLGQVDDRIDEILRDHLPGPYTFLLVNINFKYCPLSGVGIRIPDYPLTQALADGFGGPMTTTSANFSGEPPAYSLAELGETLLNPDQLSDVPDLMLDAGELPRNPPSTIVDLTTQPPRVIRQGTAAFPRTDSKE